MAEEKKWRGTWPASCQLCDLPLNSIVKYFVDGLTRYGPWALMCPFCHEADGVGLGLGKGQRNSKV